MLCSCMYTCNLYQWLKVFWCELEVVHICILNDTLLLHWLGDYHKIVIQTPTNQHLSRSLLVPIQMVQVTQSVSVLQQHSLCSNYCYCRISNLSSFGERRVRLHYDSLSLTVWDHLISVQERVQFNLVNYVGDICTGKYNYSTGQRVTLSYCSVEMLQ